jgi:quinol monooxygenase YgiN
MIGLQIMVTIQPGNRQEFLQAIDMLCSQQATDKECAYDNIFEAVDTPNQFFYLKQWTDRTLRDKYLKTNHFSALLGAIQVLGELKTIQLVELEELIDISNFTY